MKRKILSILTILASGIISINSYAEGEIEADKTIKLLQQTMNTFVQQNNIPAAAVELYVNGKLYEQYYGTAERKTIFEIGSISKIMTSILFAQEVDWAKMGLNDSVTKYVKGLPESFNKITLQELATHTAGLPFKLPENVTTSDEMEKYLSSWTSDNLPENQWQYSNIGIGLLGLSLANSTQSDFGDLYRRHIMNPLGMVNGVTVPQPLTKYYAQGYDANNQPVPHYEPGQLLAPAGGIKASAGDMQKFLSAAIGLPGTPPRVLYPMKLTQSVFVKLRNGDQQGLAWKIYAINNRSDINELLEANKANLGPSAVAEFLPRSFYSGNVLADKTGATNGFRAYIAVMPDKKSGIVILVNKNISEKSLVKTAREILFKATSLD